MPKIRGVKPDLWTDEDFVELSPFARLLWIGMWNYACDNGHLADKSKQIKMRVLPTDDVNVAELLRELESHGRITRENGVITVPNFVRHQRPDKRYFQTCDVPGCAKPDGDSQRETRSEHHETTTRPHGAHGVVSRGPLGEMRGSDGDGERKAPPRARRLPDDWAPNEQHRAIAAERGVPFDLELAKFRDWSQATGKTYKDWDATFRNWIRNARTSGTVTPIRPETDDEGRVKLPPLPSRSPWGPQ